MALLPSWCFVFSARGESEENRDGINWVVTGSEV